MKIRTFHKIIALVALMTMVFSFASCGLFNKKGSLKLESFTVDRTSVKTSYLVGEAIDFSGIKATARYSDETLNKVYTFSELTITYADDITATPGDKEVTVSFQDPHLNVKQEAKVTITVNADASGDVTTGLAVEFQRPSSLVGFNSANTSAGKTQYGEAGFAGEFLQGNKTYVVGNENEFRLNPSFAVMNDSGEITALSNFYTTVEISVYADGAYSALPATAGEGNLVSFGEYVTVDTYTGKYQFNESAEGKTFMISVLPSKDHYTYDSLNAITLEVYVIKAYNVYEAWQLAVIDNAPDRNDWDDIKTANGIKGLKVSGIVLHNNIKVTANDAPASFFLTTEKDTVYTNALTGDTVVVPAGTKYLKDWTHVYQRDDNTDFVMEGNFFTIDVSEFPLVPSLSVFGKEADVDFGEDFSNSVLFKFNSNPDHDEDTGLEPEKTATITLNNMAIKGNAKRDNLIDEAEDLASAGGLIFIKSSHHCSMNIDNVIGNSFFISYFPDSYSSIVASNIKCYDSYQNAGMIWGDSSMTIKNSYINGCGGPAIITQSVIEDNNNPDLVLENTVVDTSLSGAEIWFNAVNATPIVGGIKALGAGLAQAGLGNFVDKNDMMNVQALLMANGTDASAAVAGVTAQGLLSVNGTILNRYADDPLWGAILTHPALAQGAPFLSVNGADGNTYVVFFNGTTFCDLYGNALGTDASHQAYMAAFATAEALILTQGGLSVVFEFYHE